MKLEVMVINSDAGAAEGRFGCACTRSGDLSAAAACKDDDRDGLVRTPAPPPAVVAAVVAALQLQFGTCRVGNTPCPPTVRALRAMDAPPPNACAEVSSIAGVV